MDDFDYSYHGHDAITNVTTDHRLSFVHDNNTDMTSHGDILQGQGGGNYTYYDYGNLRTDTDAGISEIT